VERIWWTRLRWRLRGAWLWPAFALTCLADALLLRTLPAAGDGTGLVPGLLLAGFANLALVAVLAPLLGTWLRRRRRADLPQIIATDYAGTALVVSLCALLLVGGILHRPERLRQDSDRRAQLAAVHDYVLARGPSEYRAGLGASTTIELERALFRTCVPGQDPKRWLCLFVDTSQQPPGLRLDNDRAPNSAYIGPGGFELR